MYMYEYDDRKILKDRWISFVNRTHISEQEAKEVVEYYMKKHSVDEMEALKCLINLCIDKKIQLKQINPENPNSILIKNTITNLKQL